MIHRDVLMQHFILMMGNYYHSKDPKKAIKYYVQSFSHQNLSRIDNYLLQKALENIKVLKQNTTT